MIYDQHVNMKYDQHIYGIIQIFTSFKVVKIDCCFMLLQLLVKLLTCIPGWKTCMILHTCQCNKRHIVSCNLQGETFELQATMPIYTLLKYNI